MNPNIHSLLQIAQKKERIIIGLMSGTSLDGLDIALCKLSDSGKNTKVKVIHFETIAYSDEIKNEIRKVFAKKNIDFQYLVLLHEWIGLLHAKMINDALKKWKIAASEVDLIASHGQTVLHVPKSLHQQKKFPNATLQIGDGDHIAVKTGIITVSDFRQKHIAAGGEGAPLAVYGDYFLFGSNQENRILLNIGGISNFTLLPKSGNLQDAFVTDTGTGNTLIDAYTRLHFPDLAFDKDAQIAKKGTINPALLNALKSDSFFSGTFPKSTGPELFNTSFLNKAILDSDNSTLEIADVLATLTRFSAETIAEAILEIMPINTTQATTIYASGGGIHNPLLMEYLSELLPFPIQKTNDLGIDGDAKEAILFAVLANEAVAGNPKKESTASTIPLISMGKISFPN